MQGFSYKRAKDLQQAVDHLVSDVYGFSVILKSGSEWFAQTELLDAMVIVLENNWITFDEEGKAHWDEFRLEVYRLIWNRTLKSSKEIGQASSSPVGGIDDGFYRLPLLSRAALYLRTKKKMSYEDLVFILGIPSKDISDVVESSREKLLSRQLHRIEFSQEDF